MKIARLTLIFLKNSYISDFFNKEGSNKRNTLITLLFLITVTLGFASREIVTALLQVGQQTLFLGIFLIIITFFSMFQAIFSTLNILYFSKDVEQILPFPLKPYQILIAKFNALLVTEYVIEFVIGLIPLIIYASLTSANIVFYFYLFIIFIVFPIIPIIISAFTVILIMRFAKFSKNRDLFQFTAGIIATILLITGLFYFVKFPTQPSPEIPTQYETEEVTKTTVNLVDSTARFFPTIKIGINTLSNTSNLTGFVNLLYLVALTTLSYIIFISVGNSLYLAGVVGNTENSINKRIINIKSKHYKSNEIGYSYLLKELKLLFRNPIYLLQLIFPSIFLPLMLVLVLSQLLNNDNGVQLIAELHKLEIYNIDFSIVVLVIMQILSSLSYITLTSISRDGQNAKLIKYIPISLYDQFVYKSVPGFLINIFGIVITLSTTYILFPKMSILYAIILFLVALLLNILQNQLLLLVDLIKPKLNWDSEYSVIKQNTNILHQYIITLSFIVILVYFCTNFLKNINIYLTLLILSCVIGILTILLNLCVIKYNKKLFEKIN